MHKLKNVHILFLVQYCYLIHFFVQVRAAAVFALGTYIMNVPQDGQSDLSISIDHSVGSRLLSLVNDGSPIVRRVSDNIISLAIFSSVLRR